MFVFRKQPGEIVAGIGVDFSERFPESATISGAVSADTGLIVSAASVSGKILLTTVSGGTAGKDYLVTFTATGTDGSTRLGRITIKVEV